MLTESSRIKLTGYRDAGEIDNLIASWLVDVAYVDRIEDDAIYLISDEPPESADYPWIADILSHTLTKHGIAGVTIELPD